MESIEERKNREEAENRAKGEKRIETKLNKLATEIALVSGDANRFISEASVKQKANSGASAKDKNFSRRVLREVRRYEATGRTSSWLASEFTKAQALRETTSKKPQEQPESVPPSSIGDTIPIPNAPTDYEFKPINFKDGVALQPWDIYIKKAEGTEDGNPPTGYILKVIAGTISNILPSNWDDEWSVGTGLVYGIAKINTDGKSITSISIDIVGSSPSQQTPQKFGVDSSVEYLFGLFYNGATYNLLGESIYLYPRLRLVTSAEPAAAAGQSPFDLWYELGT
jgi:hypothetical protein